MKRTTRLELRRYVAFLFLLLVCLPACSETPAERPVERHKDNANSEDSTVKYPESQLVSPEEVQSGFIIKVAEAVSGASHFTVMVRASTGSVVFFKSIAMPAAGSVYGIQIAGEGAFSVISKAYDQPNKTVIHQLQTNTNLSDAVKVVKLSFAPSKNSNELVNQD